MCDLHVCRRVCVLYVRACVWYMYALCVSLCMCVLCMSVHVCMCTCESMYVCEMVVYQITVVNYRVLLILVGISCYVSQGGH